MPSPSTSLTKTLEYQPSAIGTTTNTPNVTPFATDTGPDTPVTLHEDEIGIAPVSATTKAKRQSQQPVFESTMTLPPANVDNSVLTITATISLAPQTVNLGTRPDTPPRAKKVKRQTSITGSPGPPPRHNRISTGGIVSFALVSVAAVVAVLVLASLC